jgi:5'-3' exonuclease
MAKMRQQRLRRFKSTWIQSTSDVRGWDTNSITPGTLFMGKLTKALTMMASSQEKTSGIKWMVSSSDEPGEGEHKIMAQWRLGLYQGNYAVYGLDADLIVLSILGSIQIKHPDMIWLFREEMDGGKVVYMNSGMESGMESFEWFSIHLLKEWLTKAYDNDNTKQQFLLNYCMAMSILGNDFLPSSIGFKIRNDGHDNLLEMLAKLMYHNHNLIHYDTLTVSFDSLIELFGYLSANESQSIIRFIGKKNAFLRNQSVSDSNVHFEENVLITRHGLIDNWQEIYHKEFISSTDPIQTICMNYLDGIVWNWLYYIGQYQRICYNWYYPHRLPPLWNWLDASMIHHYKEYRTSEHSGTVQFNIQVMESDIKTTEQLTIVLPLESWYLIPQCMERQFPLYAPQFYPDRFGFDSVGKLFFWECESLIPIPTIIELRQTIHSILSHASSHSAE